MCQRPGIVGTADPEPVSNSMLDLDHALGNASFNDRRFILIQGLIHDLNRKKTWHTRRCQFRVGRKARVMQPFEDQIRIHRIPARDLRDRYARRRRLKTDRPLLVVCPKPLRSTRHPKPRSVHYPWWTLSDPSTARQSGQAGRLRRDSISPRSIRRGRPGPRSRSSTARSGRTRRACRSGSTPSWASHGRTRQGIRCRPIL